jgi:hypothetical protein
MGWGEVRATTVDVETVVRFASNNGIPLCRKMGFGGLIEE